MGWWAVFNKGQAGDGSAFLGQVCLQRLRDSELIEIAYHFVPEAWGRGYATEAARALLDYGFRNLQLDQIVAVVLPDNKPSERVIHRLALPYIEDRMHAGLTHRFYALSREAYFSDKNAAT
jgi:RimJ/RimL family protein N-acetyltransferase